jgi:AhpD family alkylhydroperoxidase
VPQSKQGFLEADQTSNGAELALTWRMRVAHLVLLSWLCSACAAAHGGPALGAGENPPELSGTISGVVRAAATNTPLSGRKVTVVNVASGAKYETSTATNGGYTIKVPVGRYRIEVELTANEILSETPDEVVLNRSDLDAGRDFVIAIKR